MPVETCGSCRFDGDRYDLSDTLGTLRAVGPMWRQAIEGQPGDVLERRPAAGVWSLREYVSHSADVVANLGRLLHATLSVDDLVLPEPGPVPVPAPETMPAALDRLTDNLARLGAKAGALDEGDEAWARTATVGGDRVDAAWIVRHAVHDTTHHLMDAGRGLHLLGAGAPTQEGTVAHLHASDGGVPKRPIAVAEVVDRGVVGDRQADRKHHGRPLQALCLWSTEVIDGLRAEGHPIEPGLAGENVTVSGIDWATVRPGTQLLVGDVLVEVSAWSTPCAKNAAWFADGDVSRMDHSLHPGWSRAYAWVREPGTVRVGDPVVVEP